MRVPISSIFKCIFGVVLLAALAAGLYVAHSKLPALLKDLQSRVASQPVSPGRDVIVTIPKGVSLSQVGSILQEQDVISSRLVFKLVALRPAR